MYEYFQPIKVVKYIKSDNGGFDQIILKSRPLNQKKFIAWWQTHRGEIKVTYGIPTDTDGQNFWIGFWVIGDGFMPDLSGEYKPVTLKTILGEDKYDLYCFESLKETNHCLDKSFHHVLVSTSRFSGSTQYRFYNAGADYYYRENKNGELEKHQD